MKVSGWVAKTLVILCFLLLTSFFLHELVPHHHHAAIYGDGIQATLHSSDRYWALLVLLMFIGITVPSMRAFLEGVFASGADEHVCTIRLPRDPPSLTLTTRLFKRGILHPKLCG